MTIARQIEKGLREQGLKGFSVFMKKPGRRAYAMVIFYEEGFNADMVEKVRKVAMDAERYIKVYSNREISCECVAIDRWGGIDCKGRGKDQWCAGEFASKPGNIKLLLDTWE